MFDILSHSFPYDKILIKLGLDSSVPLPRSAYISDQLLKHQVKVNSLYSEQIKHPVEEMWEGFDRYLKT